MENYVKIFIYMVYSISNVVTNKKETSPPRVPPIALPLMVMAMHPLLFFSNPLLSSSQMLPFHAK